MLHFLPRSNRVLPSYHNTNHLMLCTEITALFAVSHVKYRNTICRRNVNFLNIKLLVRIVTTGL
jgi:hypothetical protein